MIQNLANPLSALILSSVAVVLLLGFIVVKILATVPVASLDALYYRSPGIATKEEYTGVVSWVTAHMLRVIDTKGITHEFSIDDKTAILNNDSERFTERYSDLRVMQHVRISALKDDTSERAEVVIVQ